MNREKLEELRKRIHPSTDIDAEWRFALTDLIDALLEDDDANPPESPDGSPRVDRSLRGLVLVEQQTGNKWVGWADEDGVRPDSERGPSFADEWPWAELEADGASVRKLTLEDIGFRVRNPGEWTANEEDELKSFCRGTYDIFSIADKAIEIATRKEPHEHERV